MYQSHGAQLAPAVGPFGQSVRDAVAIARQARNLSPAERQFLDDLTRSEERYKHTTMERLVKILARVEDDLLRETFPESVRTAIVAYGGAQKTPSLQDALRAETAAVSDADPVQLEVVMLEVALNPNAPIELLQQAVARTRRQVVASRTLLGSLSQLLFSRMHRARV